MKPTPNNHSKGKKKLKRPVATNLRVATQQKLIHQQMQEMDTNNQALLLQESSSYLSSPSTPVSYIDSRNKVSTKTKYDVSLNAAVQMQNLSLNSGQRSNNYLEVPRIVSTKGSSRQGSSSHIRSSSTSYLNVPSTSQGQSYDSNHLNAYNSTQRSLTQRSRPLTPTIFECKKPSYEDAFEEQPKSKRALKRADIISIRFALSAPPEIILSIFYYLSRSELVSVASPVCKEWYELAHHRQLWWHHTFASIPYYYESKQYKHFLLQEEEKKQTSKASEEKNEQTTQSNEGEQNGTTETEEKQEGNNTKKNTIIPVCKEVQIFNYKRNYYIQRSDPFIKEQQLFLNCRDYFFEHLMVKRMGALPEGSKGSAASGETSPTSANPLPQRKSSLFSFRGLFRTSPPAGPKNKQSSPSSPSANFSASFTQRNLIHRDTYSEQYLLSSSEEDLPTRRYRHSVTLVQRPDGGKVLYIIGGIKGGDFSQRNSEDFVFALECFSSSTSAKNVSTKFDLNNLRSAASEFVEPISPIETGVFDALSDTSSDSERGSPSSPMNNNGSQHRRKSHPYKPTTIRFKKIQVQGKPGHIGKHTSVAFGQKIYVFGGVESGIVTNNLYIFDTVTNTWTKDMKNHDIMPSPRTNHSSCRIGDDMYVVSGGVGPNMVPTNEVWAFNTTKGEWREINCNNSQVFTPRLGFAMTQINKKILIYGGGYWYQRSLAERYWKEKYTDFFIFDTETATWNKVNTTGDHPKTGTFPGATLIGNNWYIIGGAYENEISNEIYVLDTVSFEWTKLHQKFYGGDSLTATYFPHATENKIFIFGGYCYQPLDKFQILKLKYKDYLDANGIKSSITYRSM